MPEVVSCPKCRRRSRLPERLLGKRVKCPGCAEIFTATLDAPEVPARTEEQVRKKKDEDDSGGYEVVNEGKKKRRTDDEDDDYEVAADSKKRRRSDDDEDDERVSEKPRVSRRGGDDEDEDDEDRSRRSRRRREAEDDDDEEEAPRRRPSVRKKKRRRKQGLSFSGFNTTVQVMLGVVGLCLVLAIVGIFVPAVAIVPVAVGWLLMLGGSLWLLIIAFQDEVMHGLLCLCVPFYSLFYLITHFDETKNTLFLWLIGFGILMMGGCAGGIRGVREGDGPHRPRAEMQVPAVPAAWSPGYRAASAGALSYFPSRSSAAFASTVSSASGTPFANCCRTSFA
jgi:hypothetical protein